MRDTTPKLQRRSNPQIAVKLQDLHMYRTKQIHEMKEYQEAQALYDQKKAEMTVETDEVRKELLMMEFGKMKLPGEPSGYMEQISRLELEIEALLEKDQLAHKEALEKNKMLPISFSGSWERVLVNGKGL